MMSPQQVRRLATRRRLRRTLGVLALAQTTMAGDCRVDETQSVDARTVVGSVDPAGRADTTYATDTLVYRGPTVYDASGNRLTNFAVRWESSRADVARILGSADGRYTGTGALSDAEYIPSTVSVEVVRNGEAVVTMTPVNVAFVNGRTVRYTATVVALANRPTTLDVQSVYNLRVGDTLSLAASPRGASPGTFTTGSVDWTVADGRVAEVLPPPLGQNAVSLGTPGAVTSAPTARVRLRALAVGSTPMRVTYLARGGVRLERTVTVNVTANAARVQIDRGANSRFVEVANDAIAVDARLLDAAGQPVNPSALRFTVRDSVALTLRPKTTGCPDTEAPTSCGALITANGAEIVRRGGVVRSWVVASAGAAAADSVEITFYPAVASFAITPSPASVAVGGSVDLTVTARDASGGVIPAAAFPTPIYVVDVDGARQGVALRFGGVDRPPMVTNVAVTALPAGTPTATVAVRAGRLFGTRLIEATGTILVRSVDRVVVSPATATARVGGDNVRFTAQLLDAAGRPVTDPSVRVVWSAADSSIALVGTGADGSASVRGVRVGRTDVVATAQGVAGRGALEVTTAAVAPTLALSPSALALEPGLPGTVTATVTNGTPPVSVAWVTRDAAVATVAPGATSAVVRGVAVGETYVVATYAGAGGTARDSVRVRVTTAPSRARFLLLEPRAGEITAPASLDYRVSLFDSAGTRIGAESNGVVRYASSNAGVARVDSTTGRATGVSGGTTVIRARYVVDGREVASDTTTLLVYPPTAGHLGSVEISTAGNAREVRVGQELLFQLLVRDVNGNPVTANVPGLAVGPANSPYVDVVRAPELTSGLFYRIRAKAPTPSPAAGNPLAAVVLIRADVTGAGASVPIVVRP